MNIGYANLFCWFDLHTPDKNMSRVFYEMLFGWSFEDHMLGDELAYTGVSHRDCPFGGVEPLPSDQAAQWIGYIGVEDFQVSFDRLVALGAKVMLEGIEVPDFGKVAIFSDPAGAMFAILEPAEVDDLGWLPTRGGLGDLDWAELSVSDPQKAIAFYSEAFGWDFSEDTPEGMGDYLFIVRNGAPVGGLRRSTQQAAPPGWSFYVNVEEVGESVKKAQALSAKVLLETEVPGTVHFALLGDPQGASVGIARGS